MKQERPASGVCELGPDGHGDGVAGIRACGGARRGKRRPRVRFRVPVDLRGEREEVAEGLGVGGELQGLIAMAPLLSTLER